MGNATFAHHYCLFMFSCFSARSLIRLPTSPSMFWNYSSVGSSGNWAIHVWLFCSANSLRAVWLHYMLVFCSSFAQRFFFFFFSPHRTDSYSEHFPFIWGTSVHFKLAFFLLCPHTFCWWLASLYPCAHIIKSRWIRLKEMLLSKISLEKCISNMLEQAFMSHMEILPSDRLNVSSWRQILMLGCLTLKCKALCSLNTSS